MEKVGNMYNGIPYQYKINNKKRSIVDKEGLVSDEDEVEDIWDMENIEEILYTKYERKKGGPRLETDGRTLIQITISVEPKTPCTTNISERTPTFRQLHFNGRKTIGQGSNQGESTRGASSRSNSQISSLRRGSNSTQFKMARHDPIIRLPEF